MFGIKTKVKRVFSNFAKLKFSSSRCNLEKLKCNKIYNVLLPTYDKSGQAVHPDIFFDKQIKKFVITFTPYPFTNDKFENPSIALSDDGINFYEEKKGINPLVPAPQKDHNDAPDISYKNGTYTILYLETVRPEYQSLIALQSKDRVTWQKTIIQKCNFSKEEKPFMLSPAVAYKDKECFLFYVNRDYKNGHKLFYTTGTSIETLDFMQAKEIQSSFINELPAKTEPWHVDIIQDNNGGFLMLLCAVQRDSQKGGKYFLYIAKSKDLINWKLCKKPILKNCYRSSGFIKNNNLYIYFSSNYFADAWKIGLYKTILEL